MLTLAILSVEMDTETIMKNVMMGTLSMETDVPRLAK